MKVREKGTRRERLGAPAVDFGAVASGKATPAIGPSFRGSGARGAALNFYRIDCCVGIFRRVLGGVPEALDLSY